MQDLYLNIPIINLSNMQTTINYNGFAYSALQVYEHKKNEKKN